MSIAVELLRSDRPTIASLTSMLRSGSKNAFAHSLLAKAVESNTQPVTVRSSVSRNTVVDYEGLKKDADVLQGVSVVPMKNLEVKPGLPEAEDNSKHIGQRSVSLAKGSPAIKGESVIKTRNAYAAAFKKLEVPETINSRVLRMKRLEVSEAKKQEVSATGKQETFETKKPEVTATKKLDISETKKSVSRARSSASADEMQANDGVNKPELMLQIGTGASASDLKGAEAQPIISSGRLGDENCSESVQSLLVTAAATRRETKDSPVDAGHPAKLAGNSGDATSNFVTTEQTKNGAVVGPADLAAGGPVGMGKTEIGIGAIAAGVHGGAGSPGRDGALVASHGDGATTTSRVAVQQRFEPETTSHSNSHSAAYNDPHGMTTESKPGLLAATPTSLEVGITSGTRGWLKIRAEMEGGVVTASLSSGSIAGQEILHRELPSLAAFLQDEKIGVNALVVRQTSEAGTIGANCDGHMEGQGRPSSWHGSNSAGSGGAGDESVWGRSEQEAMYEGWREFSSSGAFLPAMVGGNGSWLNVRV